MSIKFHRLVVPTYLGGLPATHDYINNAISGTPAPADDAKVGGTNEGTFFDAFSEDATAENANRSNKALATNCDYLDDVANSAVAAPAEVEGTTTGAIDYIDISDSVFVGKFGATDNQDERNQLVLILDPVTGDVLVDAAGQELRPSIIGTTGGSSRVGLEATGFYTDPRVYFSSDIPASTDYRLVYLKQSSLSNIALVDIDALTRNLLRGGNLVSFTGGDAWADGVTNPAASVDVQLKKMLADLSVAASDSNEGADRVGAFGIVGTGVTLATGSVGTQLCELANSVGGLATENLWSVDQRFLGDIIASPTNTTPDISQTKQTGTGTAASYKRRVIGQPGKDVASGVNNDGGDVELDVGANGAGGTAGTGKRGRVIKGYPIGSTQAAALFEYDRCSGVVPWAGASTDVMAEPIADGDVVEVEVTVLVKKATTGLGGSTKLAATITRIGSTVQLESTATTIHKKDNAGLTYLVDFAADGTTGFKVTIGDDTSGHTGTCVAFLNWKVYPLLAD